MKIPFILRRLSKTKGLRLINLIGLTLIFTSIIVSFAYIKWETSFDSFYKNADRIGRLSLAFEGKQADGRIFTESYDELLKQNPEIEDILKMVVVQTTTLTNKDSKVVVNNLVLTGNNFLDFFNIPLIYGNTEDVFNKAGNIIISEKLALQLYGKTDVVGQEIKLEGRKYVLDKGFVNGVFKNIPANSHFHTDIIVSETDFSNLLMYYYLLLKKGVSNKELSHKITEAIQNTSENPIRKTAEASILPLTDIHLHSNVAKEIEPGGKIDYIYLIAGANILLLIIVLFNLWLNSSVIFSYNKRYYQLLRLNGASSSAIVKDEFRISFCISFTSLLLSFILSLYVSEYFGINLYSVSVVYYLVISVILLLLTVFTFLIPVFKSLSYTLFFNRGEELKPVRFSFSNVKYMLLVQYSIVVFVIILSVSINNQISIIRTTQIGAVNDSIVVLKEELPTEVIDNYSLLRSELLKHPEIESVTGAMQLPGEGIRDMIRIRIEGNEEIVTCPILVVGDDFFPFFGINTIAGNLPPQLAITQQEEKRMFEEKYRIESQGEKYITSVRDNYIINRKALGLLGISSPEEALGKDITLMHQSLDYIPFGKICGVVDDFVYTNVYEDVIPMLIIPRNLFMSCFMLRLSPKYPSEGLDVLNKEWEKINPDFPLNYGFLKDYYRVIYKNELNAEQMVRLFSSLCLIITLLGLIIFMAFMMKVRRKEIGIRRVNGASSLDILFMLNRSLLFWLTLSCIIAVPLSSYILNIWLANFAFKTSLTFCLFAGTCLSVIIFSLIIATWQSLKVTKINPVDSIKSE